MVPVTADTILATDMEVTAMDNLPRRSTMSKNIRKIKKIKIRNTKNTNLSTVGLVDPDLV